MTFDQLWAGWRDQYVGSVSTPTDANAHASECVFCRIVADRSPDVDRGVIATSALSIVLLNAYPYASGHLLVMPQRHVKDLGELTPAEGVDLWQLALDSAATVERAYRPDGMNIGMNLGRAAGAGIPRHLHLHIVPRWTGDTNFMTTLAAVRVLPESLPSSWEKLRAAWTS